MSDEYERVDPKTQPRQYEVFLYRCSECGTVHATTVRCEPSTHFVRCSACYARDNRRDVTLHHAIALDFASHRFVLIGWTP